MAHTRTHVGLTIARVRTLLADMDMTIRRTHSGELRVNFKGGPEATAYYAADAADAYHTAKNMYERRRKIAEQRKPMAFHDAVVHLAFNLGDMEHTLENVRDTVTVQLVADIYHVDAELLARCIMRQRANHNYGASD